MLSYDDINLQKYALKDEKKLVKCNDGKWSSGIFNLDSYKKYNFTKFF